MKLFQAALTIIRWAVVLACGAGCARFTTTQTDVSYEVSGITTRTITTKATATTFFEAKSALASFKATQTDKSQSASVGSLSQEANPTNTVQALGHIEQILRMVTIP